MTTSAGERVKRSYVSPLRTERKRETARRVVAAAGEELAAAGYAGATMAAIASRAGVSYETVHAIGQKPGLLAAALEHRVAHSPVFAEASAQMAAGAVRGGTASIIALLGAWDDTLASLWLVAVTQSASTPGLLPVLDAARARRRASCEAVAQALSSGSDPDELAATLYVATSAETYLEAELGTGRPSVHDLVEILVRPA